MRCVICMFLLTVLASVKCDGGENGTKLEYCPNVKNPIANIRKRRHLTFPDNSNVVITISLVKAFMTHAPSGWNTVLEMDVMFPLPDAKFTNKHARRKLHHRQKREVWERLRDALDFHNFNGRDCILRSICEAQAHLASPGRSLVHDILRAIFSAPIHDEDFQDELADQYEEFSDPAYCDRVPDCPISLLHFILALNKQNY